MKKEKAALDQQVQNLLEAVTSSRYAPIDALPEDFVCSSKEEMLWLDYQLAMRLQREADRPCPVEDTLDEEQIRDILGPDSDYYLPSDGDLHGQFVIVA
ncbi:unnamed protein product [Heligmosomoides polygyrus]|uniref:DUF1963 domain-containing protein n=1 Tax=Heligmosomoides polygyrus TaxID=6339 RepID=A0A3P8CPQ3_HELPZ|nr:unnamed protein product [Heligmosomoides polygyrus]